MADKIEFLIPFNEIVDDDGWRRFFPCRTVYHMGQTIDFTTDRGDNMVSNFKNHIPDFDLPINTLHSDELGVYGHIADMRMGDGWVEWLPHFNDGAVDEIKSKGYKYSSPEIVFDGYQGVYDGKIYRDVALAIAITPKPRLGRDTLVFSADGWEPYKEDGEELSVEDTEETMPEVTLNEEQMGELKEGIFAQVGKVFMKFWNGNMDDELEPEPVEPEPEPEPEPTKLEDEDNEMELAEQIQEKDSKILELEEQLEKMKELEEKAQKYDEQLKLAEEKAEEERQNARKLEFAEVAKEIHGLPEMETDFAEELMWLEDADDSEDKAHFNTLLNVLRALGEQQKTSELFSEKGNDGDLPQTVGEKIEKLVVAKMSEGMSRAEAVQAVFDENKGLYKEYDSENTKSLNRKEE